MSDALKMKETKLQTVSVPPITVGEGTPTEDTVNRNPRWLGKADIATRVVLRNVSSSATILVGLSEQAVRAVGAGQDTYELPAGACDVLVLAPFQALYFMATGDEARLTYSISEYVFPE